MKILRVSNKESLSLGNLEKIILMYRECFLEPPWRETYFYNTLLIYFEKIFSIPNLISLVSISDEEEIQGATFAYPVIFNKEINEFLEKNGVKDLHKIIYLAEIFVDNKFRNIGLGKLLHNQRLILSKEQGMEFSVERTSPASKMFSIILKDGFTPIGGMEVMSLKNISGTQIMAPDARIVSIKKI